MKTRSLRDTGVIDFTEKERRRRRGRRKKREKHSVFRRSEYTEALNVNSVCIERERGRERAARREAICTTKMRRGSERKAKGKKSKIKRLSFNCV